MWTGERCAWASLAGGWLLTLATAAAAQAPARVAAGSPAAFGAARLQADGAGSVDGGPADDGPVDGGGFLEDVDELSRLDDGRLRSSFLGSVGMLALPAAEVCTFTDAECEPGEAGLILGLSALGRIYDLAGGARITYGAGLRPTKAVGEDDGTIGREHSRSYFLFEGEFRYYLPPIGDWGVWVGATSGLVIISDAWSTLADREPAFDTAFVGPRALSLSTEGISVGLGAGGHWRLAEHWLFGTRFQYANWILPTERARTPAGDLASFAGRVDVLHVGVYGGFVLPL